MTTARGFGYRDYLRSLRAYFAQPETPDGAKAAVRDRLERRDELFLTAAERFSAPDSPYWPLLHHAKVGYRDIEVMVRQRGVEVALEALRRAGVYLSFEEFKAGGEVRRDGRVFHLTPSQFDNQRVGGMSVRSGGTRSRGTWTFLSLEHLAAVQAPQQSITLEMLSDRAAPIFSWQPGFPTGAGLGFWFTLARLRRPAVRWFSLTQIPSWAAGRRAYWGFRTAYWVARRRGLRVPMPEFVPTSEAGTVLDAVRAALVASGRCVVNTTPSCAVRLAAEATRRGETLSGVLFTTAGEPLTPGKAEEVRRAGARIVCSYPVTEVGSSAAAPCGDPIEVDDMHFRADALAMIRSPRRFGDLTVDALMLTSLLPTAPKLLLNVEVDDFAIVRERECTCIWNALGCRTHLWAVRSFSKLTGEGTTLLGSNCVHIIEQVLPETFGGASVDYQLVEAEDTARLTRLYLLISPRVGPVDEAAVLQRFAEALDGTATRPLGGRRSIWEQAQTIRVIRSDPIATGVGKQLPFHTLAASEIDRRWAENARNGGDRSHGTR